VLRDTLSGRWSGEGEGEHPCALIEIDARIIVQPHPWLLSCEAAIAMTGSRATHCCPWGIMCDHLFDRVFRDGGCDRTVPLE
jgi:hypothetical protein